MSDRSRYEDLQRQLRAVGAVKRAIVRNLPHDCPVGPTAVLSTLHRQGPTHLSLLADKMWLDISVTSRHVSHAVEQGWVERTQDPADRRSWTLSLTPAGRRMLDEISERTTGLLAERMSDWDDDEIDRLTALMARLHGSFADCTPPDRETAGTSAQA
ncbi:MarR family winged helix-turn-helix transcriptional regulator [Isoptericola sp. BMS4]|uniref:MarR family winged helix-turn-helix transcriptional regulator n=1 Tax=Isoptericola sp. BMS4 TaxID=2527875 RepID=UPI001422C67D|nr:MarR family transcriptional regulator [Isoptericola sp. BMS4]